MLILIHRQHFVFCLLEVSRSSIIFDPTHLARFYEPFCILVVIQTVY